MCVCVCVCAQPFRYIMHFFLLLLLLLLLRRRRRRSIVVVGVGVTRLIDLFERNGAPATIKHTPAPVKTQKEKEKKKNEITLIYKDSLSQLGKRPI